MTVHQLNRFWLKIWCHWKKFSVLRENRSLCLKSFFVSGMNQSLGSKAQADGSGGKKKQPLVAFIWSIWSQLLWEGCLVLLSEADPKLKSKHILPCTGRQTSAVVCTEEWMMRCVRSLTSWWWVRLNQPANRVGQEFMSTKVFLCGSVSFTWWKLLVCYHIYS